MNGYLRPLWFILIVILLALLFSYHPQSAQAQSQIQSDWPTGVKIDQNCYTANIYNNLQLKAMARHDGFVYYLKEVKNARYCTSVLNHRSPPHPDTLLPHGS